MDRVNVVSRNIKSIGYDPSINTLEVEFNSGSIYQYYTVPSSIYEGIMSANSKGTFLNDHIKGKYPYKRIH